MSLVVAECGRCRSPIEPGDLRCAVCGLAQDAGAEDAREVVRARFLRCGSCTAAVAYDASAGAPRCAFCGAETAVEEVVDPLEQTERRLPFTTTAEEARAALRGWLGRQGFFRPSDLRAAARLESLKPVFWVGWVFDAEALISWTADSDHDHGRSEWAPHAGQCTLAFEDILVSASRGLTDAETAFLTRSYDLDTAAPEAAGPDDALDEQFDVQRSMARRRVMAAIETVARDRVTRGHVPGTRFRNVHAQPLLKRLVTRRLAFPAWVMAWRYDGELYRTVVSGQDATFVKGTAPWSVAKIVGAVAVGVLFVLVVVVVLAASA